MSRNPRLPDLVLFALIIVVGLLNTADISPDPMSSYNSEIIEDTIASNTAINDSLPHYEYRQIEDSIQLLEACRQSQRGVIVNSASVMAAGFAHIHQNDICFSGAETDTYFQMLSGYYLLHDAEFYTRDGKSFLKYVVWDNNDRELRKGHYEIKEIGVRFKSDENGKEITVTRKGSVLIPVSKKSYGVIKVVTYTVMVLFGICGLCLFVLLPLRVLYSIARGVIFTVRTVRDLFIVGWGLIAFALLPAIFSFIIYKAYDSKIPDEIYLSLPLVFLQYKGLLLAGLIILMVARAFEKGRQVKMDNDAII
jgi:hypothetical protein